MLISLPKDYMDAAKKQLLHWIEDSLLNAADDWCVDRDINPNWSKDFSLIHKDTGIELWMVNGFWFFSVDRPQKLTFGAYWKCRLWPAAYRLWKAKRNPQADAETLLNLTKKCPVPPKA